MKRILLSACLFVLACDKSPVEQSGNTQIAFAVDSAVVAIDTTIAVPIQSNAPLKFISRNSGIASVDIKGAIHGVAVGSTYVIASLVDHPDVRDSIAVRVYDDFPMTGAAVPELASYDQTFRDLLRKYFVPGGAVAVMREGKLLYARGFGYADVENKIPVQPDALFRIASVSKMITATAIMKLVEDGKLNLDELVAPWIADLKPAPGAKVDPLWDQITIRNLLNHTGGWDRAKSFDPIDRVVIAANAVGAPSPASPETLIRYMKGIPLDFVPGERFAYSNFGYIILGRIIERASGMPYKDFVRTRVLSAVGANRTQQGKSHMADALPEEVRYYFPKLGVNAPLVPSVFPGEGLVPLSYGGYELEVGDAAGAWVSSTIDLLRLVGGIDGRADRPDILSAPSIAEMTANGPPFNCGGFDKCHYGMGWFIRVTAANAVTWYHGGDLPATTALVMNAYNGVTTVALFNANIAPAFDNDLYAAFWKAIDNVTSFPTHDLFPTFR